MDSLLSTLVALTELFVFEVLNEVVEQNNFVFVVMNLLSTLTVLQKIILCLSLNEVVEQNNFMFVVERSCFDSLLSTLVIEQSCLCFVF